MGKTVLPGLCSGAKICELAERVRLDTNGLYFSMVGAPPCLVVASEPERSDRTP